MKKYGHLGVSIVAIVLVLVTFSSAIGPLPPLGNFLNPTGNGIFDVGQSANYPTKEVLYFPNLTDQVTIYRDTNGIPHIYAKNDNDLYFAVGYVQAQDRLFQLELQRRLFTGTLSEILGNGTLGNDIFFRSLGLERSAQQVYNTLLIEAKTNTQTAKMMEALNAYSNGINAYIDGNNPIPYEFQLLGVKPSHWKPVYTLGLAKLQSFSLGFEQNDLSFATIVNKLGASEAYQLFPTNDSALQIPVTPNYGGYNMPAKYNFTANGSSNGAVPASVSNQVITNQVALASQNVELALNKLFSTFGDLFDKSIGSNNWVISANKSATGHPILANDMHLSWSTPSIWYQMDVHSQQSNLDVWGFVFIGSPFIVAGHNKDVAWGFTNVGGDVLDWYYYNTRGDQYYANGSWQNYTYVNDSIPVRGQADFPLTVRYTINGPIIPGADYKYSGMSLACSWIGIKSYQELGNKTLLKSLYDFNHAQNYNDFKAGVYLWDGPAQNIIYADANNIAIWVAGVIPLRGSGDPSMGRLPVNGSVANSSWVGYVPAQDWPHAFNPAQGYLASTNEKSTGPGYKYYIGSYFDPGYRARRINYLLDKTNNIDLTKMEKIQTDVFDAAAEAFVGYLLNAVANHSSGFTVPANVQSNWNYAINTLKNWNYYMFANETAPLIEVYFLSNYVTNTFSDEYQQAGLGSSAPYPALNILDNLTMNDPTSHWFTNVTSSKVQTAYTVLLQSLADGLEQIQTQMGTNPSNWLYGNWHKASFPSLAGFQALSPAIVPDNGSSFTLNNSGGRIATHGSSERAIYMLGELNQSVAALPGGQSGNPLSPHYHDLLDKYFLTWKYYPQIFYPSNQFSQFPANSIESTLILRKS